MPDSDSTKQFFNQLNNAKRILIALPAGLSADAASAGSALAMFLKRLNKEVEVLASENYEDSLPFLPKTGLLKLVLNSSQSLAVVVDTTKKALEEISYAQEEGRAKIFLKGKTEIFTPEEVSFETVRNTPYDLAIILGAQDLNDLGTVFAQNPDLFYETPKINIDNNPGNKLFGAINLIDINAASLSEIITTMLQEYETDLFNEDIATCLLAGIMAKTNSFQHAQVSPKSFIQAGLLVEKGARQQEIVRALFKTRSLPLLKLWGRSLARLKDFGDWTLSQLNFSDFEKAEADETYLPQVLKDLLENLSGKLAVGIVSQTDPSGGLKLVIAFKRGVDVPGLFGEFGAGRILPLAVPGAYDAWQFNIDSFSLEEVEAKLVSLMPKLLPKLS
ncbi:MAG: hypothetical protein AAB410_02515 [Patescibacteria group bacterium]